MIGEPYMASQPLFLSTVTQRLSFRTRVEVAETSRTSAIFEGCDLESLRNVHVPGPVAE